MGLIVNRQVAKNFVIDRKEEVINFRFRFFCLALVAWSYNIN